jgi:hypothetical protein
MKNHIQICIRNFNSIKGFFLPRDEEDFVTVLTEKYSRKSGLAQQGNINVTNPYLLIAIEPNTMNHTIRFPRQRPLCQ